MSLVMSTANDESPSDLTETSVVASSATTSGLESIALVALQALQKEHMREVDVQESSTALPNTTPSSLPPPPPTMDSASRVVSTDTMLGKEVLGESPHLQLPPEVKKEETTLSSAKASDINSSSPPLESLSGVSSPSPSPSTSEMTSNDGQNTSVEKSSQKAADFSRILADPEAWLRQTENMFSVLPPVDRSIDNEIVVQPNDVLCGRGGETNHHPGNIRYRSLVKAYQKLYLLAKRRDKPKIAQCIVVSVRGVQGRFLKRTKNKEGCSAWVDVGNVKAREKTSQALREGAPNLRENTTSPITKSANPEEATTSGSPMLVPDHSAGVSTAPATNSTLSTSTPLEAMMGWRLPTANFKGANSSTDANATTASVPSSSDANTDALTAQVFHKAAAQLMQHPAFHQLDPARQQEAILFELKNAKATVESAKRTSVSTGTTPMVSGTSIKKEQTPQSQQHHQSYPGNEYQYYQHGQHHFHPYNMYGGFWPDGAVGNQNNPSTKPEQAHILPSTKTSPNNVDLQTMYRELLVAKAAATVGNGSSLASSTDENGEKTDSDDLAGDSRRKLKKRPATALSTTISTSSLPVRSPTVVSDTGSETSSSSSCSSTSSANGTNNVKNDKAEVLSSGSRGGSRLKRLKLRMKDDFN